MVVGVSMCVLAENRLTQVREMRYPGGPPQPGTTTTSVRVFVKCPDRVDDEVDQRAEDPEGVRTSFRWNHITTHCADEQGKAAPTSNLGAIVTNYRGRPM